MKAAMALALTGLCLLAMQTVRLRNAEILRSYGIAVLERKERQMGDFLMALQADVARKTAAPRVLERAAELGVLKENAAFKDLLDHLLPPENGAPEGGLAQLAEQPEGLID